MFNPTREPHRLLLSVPSPHIVTDGGVLAYGLARGSTHRRQVPPLSVTATAKARRQEPMPDKSPRATYPSAHLRSIDKSVLEEEPRDRLFTKALHCCGLTGSARQNKALVTTQRYKSRTIKAIPGTSTSLGKPNDMISRMALSQFCSTSSGMWIFQPHCRASQSSTQMAWAENPRPEDKLL